MRASLIISGFNEGARLACAVETGLETAAGLVEEVPTVDDASTDGSAEAALRRFTPARSVENDRQGGIAPTTMLGTEHARGSHHRRVRIVQDPRSYARRPSPRAQGSASCRSRVARASVACAPPSHHFPTGRHF
jgi:hypothetical protein